MYAAARSAPWSGCWNFRRNNGNMRETISADALPQRARYQRPWVAVDTVVFAVEDKRLKTYLVQLAGGPLRDLWAFPGGLVRVSEALDCAARRELQAAAGVKDVYLEQLFTFGDPSRDPRSHVVS